MCPAGSISSTGKYLCLLRSGALHPNPNQSLPIKAQMSHPCQSVLKLQLGILFFCTSFLTLQDFHAVFQSVSQPSPFFEALGSKPDARE